MLLDGGEHAGILYAERFARDRRAEPGVQHVGCARSPASIAMRARGRFREEALGRVEPREVVEQAGQARLAGVAAVALREEFGATGDAHAVRVPVLLPEMLFERAVQELCKGGHHAPRLARRRADRLRYSPLLRLPAHMIERALVVVAIVAARIVTVVKPYLR